MTSVRKPDGEHKTRAGASWATAWWHGELSDMSTWESVSTYVGDLRHGDTAKIFQGTDSGTPTVYVFHRQ